MADFENKNNTQWNENNAAQNGASAPNAAGTADSVKNAAQNTSGAGYNTNPTDTGFSANGCKPVCLPERILPEHHTPPG